MPLTTYFSSADIPRPAWLGTDPWKITGLLPVTVLFGKNGSGKSLLLRAWRDANPTSTHYIIPERTGSLGFNANFLQNQLNPQTRREQSSGNFVNEYRQQVIARVQAYFFTRGAVRSDQLPGKIETLEELLSTLFPDFVIRLAGENPPYKLTRADTNQDITDVNQLSTGEAQILSLGLDVLTIAAIWDIQNASTRLLLLDEPDAHIHPDLQARFADFLIQVAATFNLQIVIATHSTTLLAAMGQFAAHNFSVIYLDRTKTQFTAEPYSSTLKELAACLGGHALMGPLFAVPLLLVEGDDDYRIWSQVPRHHKVSFSVIPCNGEEIYQYQRNLETIFECLRDSPTTPAGYALLDADKTLPDVKTTPQKHIRFIRMHSHEAENLFLTDEVLQLIGLTWDEACSKISAVANKHGAKSSMLSSCHTWDRPKHDLKQIIAEISQAVDPKHVHWTQRVGVALGRNKPSGMLAQFIGEDVIKALWGATPELP